MGKKSKGDKDLDEIVGDIHKNIEHHKNLINNYTDMILVLENQLQTIKDIREKS